MLANIWNTGNPSCSIGLPGGGGGGVICQLNKTTSVQMDFAGNAGEVPVNNFYSNADSRDIGVTFSGADFALNPAHGGTYNYTGLPTDIIAAVGPAGSGNFDVISATPFDSIEFLYVSDQISFTFTMFDALNNILATRTVPAQFILAPYTEWFTEGINTGSCAAPAACTRVHFSGSLGLYLIANIRLFTLIR